MTVQLWGDNPILLMLQYLWHILGWLIHNLSPGKHINVFFVINKCTSKLELLFYEKKQMSPHVRNKKDHKLHLVMLQGESFEKYTCKSYGSCVWHIVSLCSRSEWSFNQIALTVFYLQSGQKIAFSYVTRGIIWKTNKQEVWFLCKTRRLNVLYKWLKFLWNISNGYQVIERTRFCDRQTDGQRQTDARGKTICLTTLPGWRHNTQHLGCNCIIVVLWVSVFLPLDNNRI